MGCARELNFGSFNTRRNLPKNVGRKRGEGNFLAAFARAMLRDRRAPCIYGRHFAMPGCGIADLVVCNSASDDPIRQQESNRLSIVAFETKLSDWRRAIQQAYRYRYYADQSFVVLPQGREARAVENRRRFRQLGIGLCVYDPDRKSITIPCRPHASRALNPRKRELALDRIRTRALYYLRKANEDIQPLFESRKMIRV